uniref:Uncharacterized protein n=1 Tax=Parascaris univalens TaxID=6257 RepID=A0A915A202_PARUN
METIMAKRSVVYRNSKVHDFLEGCCVPTSSLLWMIIVFFIFIILVTLCGCTAIIITRLYYKWKARRRLEVEQKRRRDDDEIRRLEAFRKKQLEIQLLTKVPSKDYEAPHTQYVPLPTGVTPPSQYYWDRFNTARLPDADSDKRTVHKNNEKKMSGQNMGRVALNGAKVSEDRKESAELHKTSKHFATLENLKGVLNQLEEKTAIPPSESVTARSATHRSRRRKSHHNTPHKRSYEDKHLNRTKEERVKRRQLASEESKPSSLSPSTQSTRRRKSIRQSSNRSSSEHLVSCFIRS